jgi:G3E family GTPase
MTNGCICCTLREDLLLEIRRLADERRFDYLLIESTGISEPLPVAETFTFLDEKGTSLSDVARLDTMVTVVDAVRFLDDYRAARRLKDDRREATPDDERTVADLLVEQVEFADVILVSKSDLVSEDRRDELVAVLRGLNAEARIETMTMGRVPLDRVIGTGLFSLEKAARSPVWLKELRGEHTPESETYGIASSVYRRRLPFHPGRLHGLLSEPWTNGRLLRCKGWFWLANRYLEIGSLSQAGGEIRHGYVGRWWKFLPENEWPRDEARLAAIREKWDELAGDCRQELVFIGQAIDFDELHRRLDECLLTLDEIEQGIDEWILYDDPLGPGTAASPTPSSVTREHENRGGER